MNSNIQRASGTRSATDVLLRALLIKRRTLTDDLNDFALGITLKVTCLYRPQGATAKSLPIPGALYLTQNQPVEWYPYKQGSSHELPTPLTITAPAEKGYGQYAGFHLNTASGPVTAYIPKADIELVKHVMKLTGSWKIKG